MNERITALEQGVTHLERVSPRLSSPARSKASLATYGVTIDRKVETPKAAEVQTLCNVQPQITVSASVLADLARRDLVSHGRQVYCPTSSQFVVLCRRSRLFAEAVVAVDGSKFKAVNHRDKNSTGHKAAEEMPGPGRGASICGLQDNFSRAGRDRFCADRCVGEAN